MTQQTFTVDYGLTIIGGNTINSDTGNIAIMANSNTWTFDTTGNLTTPGSGGDISGANTISAVDLALTGNISLNGGRITGGTATVVDDGINSIALAPGAQMDVYGFPFSGGTARGQLTITGDITTVEALGTWYYQSINTNTYQLYTDSTYSTLVDASEWTAYDGGGLVAITLQSPASNVVINSNGYLSTFNNAGTLDLPGALTAVGDFGTDGNIIAHDGTFGGNIGGAGTFDVDGDASVGGNLFVSGSINFSGTVNQISGNSGVFYGNTSTGAGALYTGKTGFTPVANTILQVTGDLNDYIQVNLQNTNHGNTASMEIAITADDGNDTDNYIDIGIASSTWDGTQTNSLGTAVAPRDGYMYVQGGSAGGNLILGTTTTGRSIKFNVGGPNSANTVGEIFATGLSMVGNVRGGNLLTGGLVSATGTITGANITGANILTGGLISATGNITGGNINTGAQVSATGNITGGNITAGSTFYTPNNSGGLQTGSQASGTWNIYTHTLNSSGFKTLNIGTGAAVVNGTTTINLGSQYGISNTTVYGNLIVANTLTTLSTGTVNLSSANVSAANITTTGLMSATGNLNAGNIVTANAMIGTTVSATGNFVGNTNGYTIGYKDIPQILMNANVTLGATDGGKHYYNNTAVTTYVVTVPTFANVPLPIGTAITFINNTSGGNIQLNLQATVNVTLAGTSGSANRTVGPFGMATMMKVATDTWYINGTGVS